MIRGDKDKMHQAGDEPPIWRSLEQKAGLSTDEGGERSLASDLPEGATIVTEDVSRRGVIKFGVAATALLGLDGCVRRPVEKILPYTHAPEHVIPGVSSHYATSYASGPEVLGLVVESHEGRPTKVEGNIEHGASLGATNMQAQAAIYDLYDPDRSRSVMNGDKKASFEEFEAWFEGIIAEQEKTHGRGFAILTRPTTSPTVMRLRSAALKRLPSMRVYAYEPATQHNVRDGALLAFGKPAHALYDYARAEVVVSLDADFLQTEPGSVRAARGLADARRLESSRDDMSRLYVVESTHSTTGANADHRLRLASRDIERYARLLAKELADQGVDLGSVKEALGSPKADGIPEPWIKAVAKDLAANRGRAIVVAGARQPASVHALTHLLNAALGSVGHVVQYADVIDGAESSEGTRIGDLAKAMSGGEIEALLILGGNPVYDAPGGVGFADLLGKVKATVHVGSHHDETAEKANWHVPLAHAFEAWGDHRGMEGTLSVQQPLILPLHGAKSEIEILDLLLAKAERKTAHKHVQRTMRYDMGTGRVFSARWKRALKRGVVEDAASWVFAPSEINTQDVVGALQAPAKEPAALGPNNLEVVFITDPKLGDGRHGNNPWLIELPDPMTRIVWDNAALVSPETAKALGVSSGDLISLSKDKGKIEVAVWVQPGQADNSIAVAMGWGRKRAGRYGTGIGFDAHPLRSADAQLVMDGVAAAKTGATHQFVQTQEHDQMEGRPIAIDATLESYRQDPKFGRRKSPTPHVLPLWKPQDYSKGHKWGLNIDLNACTGCNACAIACVAENNIAFVGKDQVNRGREMHWLRVDRYFVGENESEPAVAFQPVGCVQCEEAPCENVCPVNATTHSPEGLNDMAYNRCVGTRYCANNCPYKVRRFNYLNWRGENYHDIPDTEQMSFNPNVTVRFRGVMEKCTYCVQRIQEAKIGSRRNGKALADGDILTACQQACPSQAITFGDLNDPSARVTQAAARDRNYYLLAEIGTRPRTSYLGKIRNPNKEMG